MPGRKPRRDVGHTTPLIKGENLDAVLATPFIRANKNFPPPGVLDHVGGKLGRDKGDPSRVNLIETVLPCNGGRPPPRLGNLTFIVSTPREHSVSKPAWEP